MEKDSTIDKRSTEVNTAQMEEAMKTDSNESLEETRPRKGSLMQTVAEPQRKMTMPAYGMIARRRGPTFKSLAKPPSSTWLWKTHKSLIYGFSNSSIKSSQKIALFDMDGTLIINRTARKATDWEFLFPCIPQKLRDLSNNGFRIVIASNQLGISLNLVSERDIQKKVEDFISKIGIEATVMLATKGDKFRKPEIGMWGFLENSLNTVPIDRASCVTLCNLVFCW